MTSPDLRGSKQATIDAFEAFVNGRDDPAWPLEIFLEVSNLCNLKCAMCGPFSAVNPQRNQVLAAQRRGFLDDTVWPSLEPLLDHALYVHAFGYGEPTLHPGFLDIIDRLSRFRVMTDFITNGMRLTQDLCDAVVSARVAGVTVSMSGATRADYENVYIGGEFDTVLSGLRRLAETRARANARYPRIAVNSIGFRHHIESLPAFVDLMADQGVDIVEVKKLVDDVPAMTGHAAPFRPLVEGRALDEARRRAASHGMLFSAKQYERESENEEREPLIPIDDLRRHARSVVQLHPDQSAAWTDVDALRSDMPLGDLLEIQPLSTAEFGTDAAFYCLEPFKTMYVRRNGLVKPCCFARDSAPALGDIARDTPEDIWRGRAFRTVRESIFSGSYPRHACQWCIRRGIGPQTNFIGERIRNYVIWAGDGGTSLRGGATHEVPAPNIVAARDRQRRFPATADPAEAHVDVVIPVHNAGRALESCLQSIARHTSHPYRLILIDDASTDEGVAEILARLAASSPAALVIRRPENRGFVATVNEGLALSTAPHVVILNSDTVVTSRWLEKLIEVSRSRPNVATVTPLTNNGTICSVPRLNEPNDIPPGYDVDTLAGLVEQRSLRRFPEAPTGVGFCMLMTRAALDAVGVFDADAFGAGYGEENDFCQRAIRAGFVNLIDDHTFIFHAGRGSFGGDADTLLARNLEVIRERYPNYPRDVAAFVQNDPLGAFRADIAAQAVRLAGAPPTTRIRVLHVLHRGGGTEIHARDLATTDDPDVVSYISSSDGSDLDVDEYTGGIRGRSWTFPLQAPLGPHGPLRDEGYRQALMSICRSLGIDVIHVHHLMRNTLDIADVAGALGIRYAVTLHDYFLLCPSYTLLDPAGEACGACVGRKPVEHAEACLRHAGQPVTSIAARQAEMEGFLNGASRLFAPNARVVDIFADRFPALRDRIQVVEHGHKWTDRPDRTKKGLQRHDGVRRHLNVAMIGGLEPHKGLAAVRRLLRANQRKETVFHLYGWTPDADLRGPSGEQRRIDGSAFVYHGPYDAAAIVPTLVADGIDVGLQLAVWEETFSFTVSEFAAAGIPVIAGDLGAQGERVRRCRLGWTVPDPKTPEPILQILDAILDRPETLDQATAAMRLDLALPNLNFMRTTYAQVYRELAAESGAAMNYSADKEQLLNRDYVLFLASRHVPQERPDHQNLTQELTQANAELSTLRERLRSPRHRVADSAAAILHKIPIVWPIVAKITDAILSRQQGKK